MRKLTLVLAVGSLCSPALAGPILSLTDGASPSVFANGAGAGFGGTLGNGSISFDAVGSDLTVSFTAGSNLNDIVVVHLDTKSGGFTDASMSDTADGGRTAVTNPSSGGNVAFPIQPDYALAIGSFGTVLFELTSGSLNFLQFNAGTSITLPLASVGNPAAVDWFSYYTSGTGFLSNETLPGTAYNSADNPGFNANVAISTFNRFVIREPVQPPVIIPLPPALMAGAALLALTGIARRR
jgi:hypothetical protein